jgi:hypothetical protein
MTGLTVKSLFVAAAILAPSLASATTVNLVYEGGTASGTAQITKSPAPGTKTVTVGAWGFNMDDTTGTLGDENGDFVAWCLDATHWLQGSSSYLITDDPFASSYGLTDADIARVQSVFDANYGSVDLSNSAEAAAFQMALWEALYDDDWSILTGDFTVTSTTAGAMDQAEAYLFAASTYSGGQQYSMTFLESLSGGQNLVTVAPIPLPAAGLLLLGALGGLGALRRRRTA